MSAVLRSRTGRNKRKGGQISAVGREQRSESRLSRLLAFASPLLTFLPVVCAEHRKAGATWARAFWRGARQDADASSVRPGMACRWTPLRLRSAGHPFIALLLLR